MHVTSVAALVNHIREWNRHRYPSLRERVRWSHHKAQHNSTTKHAKQKQSASQLTEADIMQLTCAILPPTTDRQQPKMKLKSQHTRLLLRCIIVSPRHFEFQSAICLNFRVSHSSDLDERNTTRSPRPYLGKCSSFQLSCPTGGLSQQRTR